MQPPFDETQFYFSLFFSTLVGLACSYVAEKKGRNMYGWFFAGLLFSFFALIALWILPSIGDQEEPDLKVEPTEKQKDLITPAEDETGRDWYYLDPQHQQVGPVRFNELKKLWEADKVTLQTYIWSPGMEKWVKIEGMIVLRQSLED